MGHLARAFLGLTLLAATLVGRAEAHPHIFIDAGVTLVFDEDGRLGAVRIVWAYDELYSLLIVEERGLDPDFDGKLTEAEQADLSGFDMNWIEGYEGDAYLMLDGVQIALSEPLEWDAAYEDGRIVTTHLRALPDRIEVAAEPAILQVYDPTYYTAYQLTLPTRMENAPESCQSQVFVPDFEAAGDRLRDALREFMGSEDAFLEDDFPPVGEFFAEEVRVTCAP
ncbi:DUF1007 family protein [Tropicimonas sp. S265A]|uniref:DUF1007 family protein n=1 Tax=Tropicimonas sp. S265A TaxID=3415134 RepID=UPI003C7B77ED